MNSKVKLTDEVRAIKELVVCKCWDLESLERINGLVFIIINYPLRYSSSLAGAVPIESGGEEVTSVVYVRTKDVAIRLSVKFSFSGNINLSFR